MTLAKILAIIMEYGPDAVDFFKKLVADFGPDGIPTEEEIQAARAEMPAKLEPVPEEPI